MAETIVSALLGPDNAAEHFSLVALSHHVSKGT